MRENFAKVHYSDINVVETQQRIYIFCFIYTIVVLKSVYICCYSFIFLAWELLEADHEIKKRTKFGEWKKESWEEKKLILCRLKVFTWVYILECMYIRMCRYILGVMRPHVSIWKLNWEIFKPLARFNIRDFFIFYNFIFNYILFI